LKENQDASPLPNQEPEIDGSFDSDQMINDQIMSSLDLLK